MKHSKSSQNIFFDYHHHLCGGNSFFKPPKTSGALLEDVADLLEAYEKYQLEHKRKKKIFFHHGLIQFQPILTSICNATLNLWKALC